MAPASLQYSDDTCNLGINLTAEQSKVAKEFLLGLISGKVRAEPTVPSAEDLLEIRQGLHEEDQRRSGVQTRATPRADEIEVISSEASTAEIFPSISIPSISIPSISLPEPTDAELAAIEAEVPRLCEVCQAEFESPIKAAKYCSDPCRAEAHKRKKQARTLKGATEIHTCESCRQEFGSISGLRGHQKVHAGEKQTRAERKREEAAKSSPVAVKSSGSSRPPMQFPCPEEGCKRVYEDSNRLAHHKRVIHDPWPTPKIEVMKSSSGGGRRIA